MMAAVVLPDIPSDEPIDLRDHYYRERPAFFGLGAATIGWSMMREFMLEGRLPEPANLAFHVVFLSLCMLAALVRRPRLHEGFAVLMAILFVIYIAALFARLGN